MTTCQAAACESTTYGRGFCKLHYHQDRIKNQRKVEQRVCAVPTCDALTRKGRNTIYCEGHEGRLRRLGHLEAERPLGKRITPPELRFWQYVEKTDTCWTWTGGMVKGYGAFAITHDRAVRAHRFAYELLVGPIPEGLTLDHLCEVTACVNPAHLEPVTASENIRRRWQRLREKAQSCG